jgi:hypothetical protein
MFTHSTPRSPQDGFERVREQRVAIMDQVLRVSAIITMRNCSVMANSAGQPARSSQAFQAPYPLEIMRESSRRFSGHYGMRLAVENCTTEADIRNLDHR